MPWAGHTIVRGATAASGVHHPALVPLSRTDRRLDAPALQLDALSTTHQVGEHVLETFENAVNEYRASKGPKREAAVGVS